MKKTIFILLILLIVQSCKKNDNTIPYALSETEDIKSVLIKRLDREIERYSLSDEATRKQILKDNQSELKGFSLIVEGSDSISDALVGLFSSWPATTMFMPQVESIYTDLNQEEVAFGRIVETARNNNLDLRPAKFVTVTWGDPRSIILMDTDSVQLVFLALNHYLGPLNEAYNGWADYRKALKTRDMIPVDMAEALIRTAYPYSPEPDKDNVLTRLVYEGVIAVAKQAMVPNATVSMVLGLTSDNYLKVEHEKEQIWRQLATDSRLYSSDADLISKLFDFVPVSTPLGAGVPGRATRVLGYDIVTQYIGQNPEITLKELLKPEFYNRSAELIRNFKVD